MKSFCVREKIKTDSVPGSEKYVRTKNNRLMLKSKCASCGITKTRFVSDKKGRGVGQTINKKIGDKIPGFQQSQDVASFIMGLTGGDKKLFDKYWSGDIAKGAFNKKTGLFSKKFWTRPSDKQDPSCSGIVWKNGKWHNTYCD